MDVSSSLVAGEQVGWTLTSGALSSTTGEHRSGTLHDNSSLASGKVGPIVSITYAEGHR